MRREIFKTRKINHQEASNSQEWYKLPMRIGALQCNFEEGEKGTLDVADKWNRMGLNAEQLFHPCADSYSAMFDNKKHGAILKKYIKKAKALKHRIILYLNIHILGPSLAKHYKSWAQCDVHGHFPKLYEVYYATCYNSGWKRYFFEVLNSLKNYDIDGIFLDGPVIIKGGCHCECCKAKHYEWFGRKMPQADTSFEFNKKTILTFISDTYRHIKSINPNWIVYENLCIEAAFSNAYEFKDMLQYNDIVGTEGGFMFYGPPKNAYLWRVGFQTRLLEAIVPEKPRVIFMAGDQKPWSWYHHQPAETALCIASVVANGGNVWYGLHGSTELLKSEGSKKAKAIFNFLKQHEIFYVNTKSVASVALFFCYQNDYAAGYESEESDLYGKSAKNDSMTYIGDNKQGARALADVLIRGHIPFDIITDIDIHSLELNRYQCVILPSVSCMSEELVNHLRRYVQNGGENYRIFYYLSF